MIIGFLFAGMAETATDFNSYCFDKNVNLNEVHHSLEILLLPKDIVSLRSEESCLDIVVSPDRRILFEKYLSKRYSLKSGNKEKLRLQDLDCHLNFKITLSNKVENNSSVELLLGVEKKGELAIGEEAVEVGCQLQGSDKANLIFSFLEKTKGYNYLQRLVKKGEWISMSSVLNELNERKRKQFKMKKIR